MLMIVVNTLAVLFINFYNSTMKMSEWIVLTQMISYFFFLNSDTKNVKLQI